jgi:nitroreductase
MNPVLDAMYHELKDHQAIGSCLQNMLLAAHSLGLGVVWLGEILKNSDRVRDLLGLSEDLELMAVLALGHPARRNQTSTRKSLEEVIVFEK